MSFQIRKRRTSRRNRRNRRNRRSRRGGAINVGLGAFRIGQRVEAHNLGNWVPGTIVGFRNLEGGSAIEIRLDTDRHGQPPAIFPIRLVRLMNNEMVNN